MFWNADCSLLRAQGFSCGLDILYGGLEISKLQYFFDQKNNKKIFSYKFFPILVIKTLNPDCIRIRIGIQPKMLEPDSESMNLDSETLALTLL